LFADGSNLGIEGGELFRGKSYFGVLDIGVSGML
jgi:hypothetical protein